MECPQQDELSRENSMATIVRLGSGKAWHSINEVMMILIKFGIKSVDDINYDDMQGFFFKNW